MSPLGLIHRSIQDSTQVESWPDCLSAASEFPVPVREEPVAGNRHLLSFQRPPATQANHASSFVSLLINGSLVRAQQAEPIREISKGCRDAALFYWVVGKLVVIHFLPHTLLHQVPFSQCLKVGNVGKNGDALYRCHEIGCKHWRRFTVSDIAANHLTLSLT